MRIIKFLIFTFTVILVSCTTSNDQDSSDKYKKEIFQVEAEFAKMADEVGIKEAFVAFADDSAVLNRNNNLVKGMQAISEIYSNEAYKEIKLDWKPDFIDVSSSGDLAYTYGQYTLTVKDSVGDEVQSKGVFHTVWRRQPDGSWKYVWD